MGDYTGIGDGGLNYIGETGITISGFTTTGETTAESPDFARKDHLSRFGIEIRPAEGHEHRGVFNTGFQWIANSTTTPLINFDDQNWVMLTGLSMRNKYTVVEFNNNCWYVWVQQCLLSNSGGTDYIIYSSSERAHIWSCLLSGDPDNKNTYGVYVFNNNQTHKFSHLVITDCTYGVMPPDEDLNAFEYYACANVVTYNCDYFYDPNSQTYWDWDYASDNASSTYTVQAPPGGIGNYQSNVVAADFRKAEFCTPNETFLDRDFHIHPDSPLAENWSSGLNVLDYDIDDDKWLSSQSVSYTHLTLPTTCTPCRSRWSPDH